jgi:hypothetical protein
VVRSWLYKRLLRCRIDEVINFAIAIPTGRDSGNRPGTSSTHKETVTGDRYFRNRTGFLPIATKDSTKIIKETLILTSCAILVFNRSRNCTLLLLHSWTDFAIIPERQRSLLLCPSSALCAELYRKLSHEGGNRYHPNIDDRTIDWQGKYEIVFFLASTARSNSKGRKEQGSQKEQKRGRGTIAPSLHRNHNRQKKSFFGIDRELSGP